MVAWLALRPQSLPSRLALANALRHEGNSSEAADVLQQTLTLHPDCPDAHVALGCLLTEAREYEQALAHVQEALKLQPDSPAAQELLGQLLFLAGRSDEAVAYRVHYDRRRIVRDPNDRGALLSLGNSLCFAGALAEAREVWDRALALDPGDLNAYRQIWQQLMWTGCFEAALHYCRQHRAAQRRAAQCAGFVDDGTRYLTSTWAAHIGHIASLDYYLKSCHLGWNSAKRIVLLATPWQISNLCYLDYWKRYVEVVSDPVEIQRLTPRAACFEDDLPIVSFDKTDEHVYITLAGARVQQRWHAEGRKPLLTLSEEHIRRGRDWLNSLGVPAHAWFVTAHVREPGFHGVPYQSHRDASPLNYLKAFQHISARGGWVIRTGNPGMTPLPPLDRVIDYAHFTDRRDWIDVFLAGQCRFHIGTQSGLSYVPGTFGVPTAWTNFAAWGIPGRLPEDLFITKEFWSEAAGRPLTLEEILSTDMAVNQFDFRLTRNGSIRLRENTEEEILEVVREMLDRMDGAFSTTRQDEQSQARVRALAAKYGFTINAKAGQAYLRRHPYLLNE